MLRVSRHRKLGLKSLDIFLKNVSFARKFSQQTNLESKPEKSGPEDALVVHQSTSLQASSKIVPVFKKASEYMLRVALKDEHTDYSYYSLALTAGTISKEINDAMPFQRPGERVAFLCPNDATYVLTQWAIWMAGHIAVPLSYLHPVDLLCYYVLDCQATVLVTTPMYADIMDQVAKKCQKKLIFIDDFLRRESAASTITPDTVDVSKIEKLGLPDEFYENSKAMILYTSGTTGNPKGVVLTHRNIDAQVQTLVKAWKWSHKDCVLHTLPLHHIHGIVNVLLCPLYVGAKCFMRPRFDVGDVWSLLLSINVRPEDRINMYMAVPTIYMKLIQEYDRIFKKNAKMIEYVNQTLRSKIRLMISGSAALPAPLFNRWCEISGHKLLERYGMTEIGMSISNIYKPTKDYDKLKPLEGYEMITDFKEREPGYVGLPLPGVSVRLAEKLSGNNYKPIMECVGESSETPIMYKLFETVTETTVDEDHVRKIEKSETEGGSTQNFPTGEILVKGDTVFKEYHGKIVETAIEFTKDGWFRTGDIGCFDTEKKLFKILGRGSVDIIKSGGYKISSLHVETILLEHPDIKEVVVVGLPDTTWGEKVAAIIVKKEGAPEFTLNLVREWAKTRLPNYSLPTVIRTIDDIPKNAMGKVNKKELVAKVFPETVKKDNKKDKKE